MRVTRTKLSGCVIIEPVVHNDNRGFFMETYQVDRYTDLAGISLPMLQDNVSHSKSKVLRGLHFQKRRPQGRLVSVLSGEVFDVAIDIRPDSLTYGQWDSITLSAENKKQIWIPPGFAHGFLVTSGSADLVYKCSGYYDPDDEGRILWNDPALSIDWPIRDPILSSLDANAPMLEDLRL